MLIGRDTYCGTAPRCSLRQKGKNVSRVALRGQKRRPRPLRFYCRGHLFDRPFRWFLAKRSGSLPPFSIGTGRNSGRFWCADTISEASFYELWDWTAGLFKRTLVVPDWEQRYKRNDVRSYPQNPKLLQHGFQVSTPRAPPRASLQQHLQSECASNELRLF